VYVVTFVFRLFPARNGRATKSKSNYAAIGGIKDDGTSSVKVELVKRIYRVPHRDLNFR
jgi:hypothetical protein